MDNDKYRIMDASGGIARPVGLRSHLHMDASEVCKTCGGARMLANVHTSEPQVGLAPAPGWTGPIVHPDADGLIVCGVGEGCMCPDCVTVSHPVAHARLVTKADIDAFMPSPPRIAKLAHNCKCACIVCDACLGARARAVPGDGVSS